MDILFDFVEFECGWIVGCNQFLMLWLVVDLDMFVSLMLKLVEVVLNFFMLESVMGGEVWGCYFFVGMKFDLIWDCCDGCVCINCNVCYFDEFEVDDCLVLDSLCVLIVEICIDMFEGVFVGVVGLFGYLGYDMIWLVECLFDVNFDLLGLLDVVMLCFLVVVVLDGVKGEVLFCVFVWYFDIFVCVVYVQMVEWLMEVLCLLDCQFSELCVLGYDFSVGELCLNFSKFVYLVVVEKVKDYICVGDIFQVVLLQCWVMDFLLLLFLLYCSLCCINLLFFMFYLNFGGFQIVGVLFEILVCLCGGEVMICFIVGICFCGVILDEDNVFEVDLLVDQKELVEYLMLLDFGCNDVGCVVKMGMVKLIE